MNVAQEIFVVFFAIFWGTSANAWPRWKPFHWAFVPFSGRARLRVVLSLILLNVVPLLYFSWMLVQLHGSIPDDAFASFSSASKVVVPAIVPAFAVFGLYRIWVALIEFCPRRFYYENDTEMIENVKRDVAIRAHIRLEPTVETLNVKEWACWPNFLFGSLYLLVATAVPVLWPPTG